MFLIQTSLQKNGYSSPTAGGSHPDRLQRLAVYGEPGRIAAYRDGSVWRMVIVVFGLELEEEPEMVISHESRDLKFFSKEELKDIEIVITHSDIVEELFLNK